MYDNHCGVHNATDVITTCKVLTNTDYLEFFITSVAEFPGILVTLILSDLIGLVKTVFLFGIRESITGAYQALIVYTPKSYPTRIRASAIALCNTMSGVGAIITPFVATVLIQRNFYATVFVYAGVAIMSGVTSFLLPHETKGAKLGDEGKRRFLCRS